MEQQNTSGKEHLMALVLPAADVAVTVHVAAGLLTLAAAEAQGRHQQAAPAPRRGFLRRRVEACFSVQAPAA
jgi:hypothetical protein